MTNENEKLKAVLKALLTPPPGRLPDYADDPVIKVRAGRMIAAAAIRANKQSKTGR